MTLHILSKDIRRLWPGMAASFVVLGALARQDRWRGGWGPSISEGYLNLLVPILWAVLIALAVTQDPIPGDRQFWITRPFRRAPMLGAKLLFAVIVAHLPMLAADCYVLAARGFSPPAYAVQLLTRQLVLACALTIPAIALASLVRSFTHFALLLVTIAAAFLLVAGRFVVVPYQWDVVECARRLLLGALAVIAGSVILVAQYFGRRVLFSRAVGTAAAAVAVLGYALLAPPAAVAIRSTLSPARTQPAIELDTAPRTSYTGWDRHAAVVALPVKFAGVPDGVSVVGSAFRSELLAADGSRYVENARPSYGPAPKRSHDFNLVAPYWLSLPAPTWLVLRIDPAVFAPLTRGPATVRGEAGFELYGTGNPTALRVGQRATVPGVGLCATREFEDPFSGGHLMIECETPAGDIAPTQVRFFEPDRVQDWKSSLVPARTYVGPGLDWLSPLRRSAGSVNVGYDRLAMPPATAANAVVEIRPRLPLGYAKVKYEFRDLDLRKYLVIPSGAIGTTAFRMLTAPTPRPEPAISPAPGARPAR
jgi:hypothetical protein